MDDLNNNNQPQDPQQPPQNPYNQQQNPYNQQPQQNPYDQQQYQGQMQQQDPYAQQNYYQQPQQMNYYQQPVQQPSKGLSIASMVLGILAATSSCAFYCSIPLGIIGLILGIVSIKKQKPGKGMSIAGIICSSFGIAIGIITIIVVITGLSSNSPFWTEFKDAYSSAYSSAYNQ